MQADLNKQLRRNQDRHEKDSKDKQATDQELIAFLTFAIFIAKAALIFIIKLDFHAPLSSVTYMGIAIFLNPVLKFTILQGSQ